jgi:hypothetical protein
MPFLIPTAARPTAAARSQNDDNFLVGPSKPKLNSLRTTFSEICDSGADDTALKNRH